MTAQNVYSIRNTIRKGKAIARECYSCMRHQDNAFSHMTTQGNYVVYAEMSATRNARNRM